MNYESIDWEAEAKRISRAFGLEGECRFHMRCRKTPQDESERNTDSGFRTLRQISGEYARLASGVHFWSDYRRAGRTFCLYASLNSRLYVHMDWNGKCGFHLEDPFHYSAMLKGLFHLGLLSSAVEQGLQTSVTAHEKMEWTREYCEE